MTTIPKELILALIPARSGSKGVPRKNVKNLCGLPLIAYTLQEAKKSKYIGRIVVSTDNRDIATIAQTYGAEIPFMRPLELAQDNVAEIAVIQHALQWMQENENYTPEIVVVLRATAPLKKTHHIDEAISLLIHHEDADSVRSVTVARQHPLKTWRVIDRRLIPFVTENAYGISEAYNCPRQQLPKAYIQNGAIDVIRLATLIEKKSLTGDVILPYIMEEKDSINIDSVFDFEEAERLLKATAKS